MNNSLKEYNLVKTVMLGALDRFDMSETFLNTYCLRKTIILLIGDPLRKQCLEGLDMSVWDNFTSMT